MTSIVRRAVALACALACMLWALPAAAQTVPTLTSDRDDYAPGEIAVLMGAGFLPYEQVDLSISIDDPVTGLHIGDYDWTVEQADADGNFVTFYVIPPEAAGMVLTALAMGYDSGFTATTKFTDSHFTLVSASITASGNSVTVTVTIGGGTPSPNGVEATVAPSVGANVPLSLDPVSTTTTTSTWSGTFTGNCGTSYLLKHVHVLRAGHNRNFNNVDIGPAVTAPCPPPCPTNAAPMLSASDFIAGEVCAGVPQTFTVTPQDFGYTAGDPDGDPVTVTFDDGTTSKSVTFDVGDPPVTLTLKATDDPSARNVLVCQPLTPMSTMLDVTVGFTVHAAPPQSPPILGASDLDLGHICLGSGTDLVWPVSPADFSPVVSDPEGDPVAVSLDVSSVTLSLPPGQSDLQVSVPVVLTAIDDPSARDDPLCPPLTPLSSSATVYVNATLHRNHAPTITASNLNLGSIVGCLVGDSFQTTVSFTPQDFNVSTSDPDGDPVTVTASASSATLIGPGLASCTVTLTATDDPSGRTQGTCAPMSTSTSVTVSAQIIYNFQGFLSPLSNSSTTTVRRGSTVPVKFRLFDCAGTEIMTPAGGGSHLIEVLYKSGAVPTGDPTITDAGTSNDNGSAFRYGNGSWIYNLKCQTGFAAGNSYQIRARLNDGTLRTLAAPDGPGETVISIK